MGLSADRAGEKKARTRAWACTRFFGGEPGALGALAGAHAARHGIWHGMRHIMLACLVCLTVLAFSSVLSPAAAYADGEKYNDQFSIVYYDKQGNQITDGATISAELFKDGVYAVVYDEAQVYEKTVNTYFGWDFKVNGEVPGLAWSITDVQSVMFGENHRVFLLRYVDEVVPGDVVTLRLHYYSYGPTLYGEPTVFYTNLYAGALELVVGGGEGEVGDEDEENSKPVEGDGQIKDEEGNGGPDGDATGGGDGDATGDGGDGGNEETGGSAGTSGGGPDESDDTPHAGNENGGAADDGDLSGGVALGGSVGGGSDSGESSGGTQGSDGSGETTKPETTPSLDGALDFQDVVRVGEHALDGLPTSDNARVLSAKANDGQTLAAVAAESQVVPELHEASSADIEAGGSGKLYRVVGGSAVDADAADTQGDSLRVAGGALLAFAAIVALLGLTLAGGMLTRLLRYKIGREKGSRLVAC